MAQKRPTDCHLPVCPVVTGEHGKMKEPRYSMQEMIIYMLCIFAFGNASGGLVFSRASAPPETLLRIERKVEALERSLVMMKEQISEMRLKEEIKKEKK